MAFIAFYLTSSAQSIICRVGCYILFLQKQDPFQLATKIMFLFTFSSKHKHTLLLDFHAQLSIGFFSGCRMLLRNQEEQTWFISLSRHIFQLVDIYGCFSDLLDNRRRVNICGEGSAGLERVWKLFRYSYWGPFWSVLYRTFTVF